MGTMEKRKLNNNWNVNSWKNYKLLQQPTWPDEKKYNSVIKILILLYNQIQRKLKLEVMKFLIIHLYT